jgi:hypothetical protein
MTKLEITKLIASKTASYCTSATISALITANTPVKKPYQKVVIFIGAFMVASLLEKPVEDYVNSSIDEIASGIDQIKILYVAK